MPGVFRIVDYAWRGDCQKTRPTKKGPRDLMYSAVCRVFLISWTPVAIYSAGVLLAVASGWEPDVQIFASRGATDAQVAETIREAMPIVMEPFMTGRHIANGAALLLLVVLQHRVCGISIRRAIAAAAAAGFVATLAVILA